MQKQGIENYLDDIFILKDEFTDAIDTGMGILRKYIIKSENPKKNKDTEHSRFMKEYESHLVNNLPKKTVEKIVLVVEEILTNIEEHGHKYDENKSAVIYTGIFGNCVYVSLQGEGPGYDPSKVRNCCINPDGSVHMGTRGRGHSMIKTLTDKAIAHNAGREWYLLFRKDAA